MTFGISELKSFTSALQDKPAILISTHIHPDADAIGSVLAIREILLQFGTEPHIILEEGCPKRYQFLPGSEFIEDYRLVSNTQPFSKAVIVDSGSFDRIGNVQSLCVKDPWIVNLDHHISNSGFGSINWVDTNCSATSELIFELNAALNLSPTASLANNLYAGILTDTGRFRYPCTTSKTLKIASELMTHGADVFEITDKLYYSIPAKDVRSMGEIFSSLELHGNGLVSILLVREEDVVGDPDTIVDIAVSINGVEVAAMLSETNEGKIRVSLRSKHYVNVSDIATGFGGGGHARAAGFRMRGTLQSVRERIIPKLVECACAGSNQPMEKAN